MRDLDEDGWSHDSDDTPTNETANGRSSLAERQRPESLETILNFSADEWEAEPEPEEAAPSGGEQRSIQVVRKGNNGIHKSSQIIIFKPSSITYNQ